MKVHADDGSQLNASFSARASHHEIWLFVESRSGGRAKPRNSDYSKGLELLLARLGERSASLLSVEVYSRRTQSWDIARRRINATGFPYPINLRLLGDVEGFRLQLAKSSAALGRPAGSNPGGGGPNKRLRLVLHWPSAAGMSDSEIEEALAFRSKMQPDDA